VLKSYLEGDWENAL